MDLPVPSRDVFESWQTLTDDAREIRTIAKWIDHHLSDGALSQTIQPVSARTATTVQKINSWSEVTQSLNETRTRT